MFNSLWQKRHKFHLKLTELFSKSSRRRDVRLRPTDWPLFYSQVPDFQLIKLIQTQRTQRIYLNGTLSLSWKLSCSFSPSQFYNNYRFKRSTYNNVCRRAHAKHIHTNINIKIYGITKSFRVISAA